MRSSRAFIALACLLTVSSAHAAIRTCVSSSPGHVVSDQFSRLPGGGVTWMDDWDPQNRVLVAQPAGAQPVQITITGMDFSGAPSTSADGTIFSAMLPRSGITGTLPSLYAFTVDATGPTVSRKIAPFETGDIPTEPQAFPNGRVMFQSLHTGGKPLVVVSDPGATTSQPVKSNLGTFNHVNGIGAGGGGGMVVVGDLDGDGYDSMCVGSVTGGLTQKLTLQGNNFSSPVCSSAMFACVATNSAGDSTVIVSAREAGSGIATGRRQYQPLLIRKRISLAADSSSSTIAICDTDHLYLSNIDDMSVWDDLDDGMVANPLMSAISASPVPILSVGEMIDGQLISALSLSPQSFTDTGELLFHADFVGGGSGIYAISVPEPMSAALALVAAPLLRRRR